MNIENSNYLLNEDVIQNYSSIEEETWQKLIANCLQSHSKKIHPDILNGLKKLGVFDGKIPLIKDLNLKLLNYGWQLIPAIGFLPPQEYLKKVAERQLPVTLEIRSNDNLEFSVVPDYFHEIFGHIGLLTSEIYSEFLVKWAKLSQLAFNVPKDSSYYLAIRENIISKKSKKNLSVESNIKVDVNEELTSSEFSQLSRIGWWSVESGIVRSDNELYFYGAAVISSLYECRKFIEQSNIARLNINSGFVPFDPTTCQPQYYFIDDFKELNQLLNIFLEKMSFKKGGVESLETAKISNEKAIVEFNSGRVIRGQIKGWNINKIQNSLEIQYIENEYPFTEFFELNDRIISVYPARGEGIVL